MSREVKRVTFDFCWPIGKIWTGYINPYLDKRLDCIQCNGTGSSPGMRRLEDRWYGPEEWSHNLKQEDVQALIDGDRLWDFTRRPINKDQREIVKMKLANGGNSWLPFNNGYIPTAREVNDWSRIGFGHDSLNEWICLKAKAKRIGIEVYCSVCKGEGDCWECKEDKVKYDEWKPYDPPVGKWYQMWETCSDGSPISLVFKTPEELAKWLDETGASSFGSMIASYDQWLAMIEEKECISLVSINSVVKSGVEIAGEVKNEKV